MTAIGISRATARLDEVKAYYSTSIGIELLTAKTYEDGSEQVVYMYKKPTKGIQINFWANRKTANDAKFTPKDFEDYMRAVHDKIMISDVCGFDQWMDNHYAYDGDMSSGGPPAMIDEYANHGKRLGLPFHWWSAPGMGSDHPAFGKMHPEHQHRQL